MKTTKRQQRLQKIAKVVAIVLAGLMVLGTLSSALVVLAAPIAVDATVLPRQEILFQSRTLPSEQHYIVPNGGVLLVEKGVTLVIEGSLEVVGTLKNEGTIIVTGRTKPGPSGEDTESYVAGSLSNLGVIENKGRIVAATASINNYPRATFYNEGILRLENVRDSGSLFHNMSRPRGDTTEGATLVNTGRIEVENIVGTGLRNHTAAVIDNTKGIITFTETGTIAGEISGNAPITKEQYQKMQQSRMAG